MKKFAVLLCLVSIHAWAADATTESVSLQVQAPPSNEATAPSNAAPVPAVTATTAEKSAAPTADTVKVIPAAPSEVAIPVHLEEAKKAESTSGTGFKLIMSLSIVGVMACAGYFLIKKYARP